MKAVLTTDGILESGHYSSLIEILSEIFLESKILTLAHRPGIVLGHIELHAIQSTFLSKEIHSSTELFQKPLKSYGALKNLFASCENDLVFNISLGLSHSIKRCEDSYQITYLYDWCFDHTTYRGLLEKIFGPGIEKKMWQELANANEVWVSSNRLYERLKKDFSNVSFIPMPFKIEEYPLMPTGLFAHDYYVIESEGMNLKEAKDLIDYFIARNVKFKFVGSDEHLSDLKQGLSDDRFFGNRCAGEMAPMLAGSAALITKKTNGFPELAIGTLSTGRPVIAFKNVTLRDYLPQESTIWIEEWNLGQLQEAMAVEISNRKLRSADSIHQSVKMNNELAFRSKLKELALRDWNGQERPQECC